jgi:hypothetical protein
MIGTKRDKMKKNIKFEKDTKVFELNLAGFINAVSFKESSSNLSLSLKNPTNIEAAKASNKQGFLGLFQLGEEALYDLGYYAGDYGISYKDKSNDPALQQKWDSQFDRNNWSGKWSGKRNIHSKSDFLNNPQAQYEIIKEWIAYLCKQLRSNCINEYYGKTIDGVEITESGAIAGAHLVGLVGLGAFLGIPKKKYMGKKQTDGNGTHIKQYIKDFGGFDLENCCNRKIYIELMDKNNNPLVSKEVTIISTYNGKYATGEARIKARSDENGKLPVIVRHPNSEIRILADGKESNTIVQKANEKQKAVLSDFSITKYSAALAENSIPQPAPQPDKTPQEIRNEQASGTMNEKTPSEVKQDVQFNISLIEGDSGRVITSLRFYVTYKGNIKEHRTDQQGMKQGIVAEEGQDIEVSVAGEGSYQVIHHFKVSSAMSDQTIKIKLPVQSFEILVKKDSKPVPNTVFSVFYRNREIAKRTNSQGIIKVKMLVGFVYGFGIHERALTHVRVIKGNARREFTVNESTIKASRLFEVAAEKQKQVNQLHAQQRQAKDKSVADKATAEAKKAQDAAKKAKADQEKAASNQQDTHTQNTGKPLTIIGEQAPSTSDTTRYHIYHDGKIKRENKAATGFAEFIYYDENNTEHYIGKTAFIVAPRRAIGNGIIGGNVYLVDQRTLKSYRTNDGKIGYHWDIYLPNRERYYVKGDAFAAIIGAMCSLGYGYYQGSGFSDKQGRSVGSQTHVNGINGDFRYLGINNCHKSGPVLVSQASRFDWETNLNFVKALYLFGYKAFGSQVMKRAGQPDKILPHSAFTNAEHDNHLHLQGYAPVIIDI